MSNKNSRRKPAVNVFPFTNLIRLENHYEMWYNVIVANDTNYKKETYEEQNMKREDI